MPAQDLTKDVHLVLALNVESVLTVTLTLKENAKDRKTSSITALNMLEKIPANSVNMNTTSTPEELVVEFPTMIALKLIN